ncbi:MULTISPECIES: leucine efflux protein LeuE [unclassified Acinetobacter]|uniref:leucine efflux protein LeuE n=1 Tax=unclassified Acinetobacter TaxID=196816 RepID=UPI0035B6C25A
MFGIIHLGTYILGTIAIILLPGPNSLFCLAVSAQQGIKEGYKTLAGIMLGDTVLILATVFGASTMLKLYPELFHAIKIIGGLYLAYIGIQLLKGAWQKWQSFYQNQLLAQDSQENENQTNENQANKKSVAEQKNQLAPYAPKHPWSNFNRALLLSLTNPKAILFFLSFFVQFVDPNFTNPLLSFLFLAIILQLASFLYLNLLIFAGQHLVAKFSDKVRLASIAMAMVGLMFIGFAMKLWMAKI